MDYHALEKMTVAQLREEVKKHPDIAGEGGMKKDQLVEALAQKLGLEKPASRPPKPKSAGTLDKAGMKHKIVELKAERAKAREGKDKKKTTMLRRRIHSLKRRMGGAA
jgi:hypothetical protein